jgi:hypothetical protein
VGRASYRERRRHPPLTPRPGIQNGSAHGASPYSHPLNRRTRRPASGRKKERKMKESRSMFLTVSSTPRRDRRVLAVTLGHHHKPFLWLGVGGDRTHARTYVRAWLAGWPPCPRSVWLAGRSAPRAAARIAPWGARKRRRSGWANDTRLAPPTSVFYLVYLSTAPERPRKNGYVRVLGNVSRAAREGTFAAGIESSSRRFRFDAGPKNAEIAPPPWYCNWKLEIGGAPATHSVPLRRLAQTPLGLSARALPPV